MRSRLNAPSIRNRLPRRREAALGAMSEPHALIAGAGIGGLSAALWLAAAGWRVSIFESAADA